MAARWVAAAPMLTARVGFDAVLLGDGTVLAVGDDYACIPGGASEGSERADVYDPTTDTWIEVQGLNKPRKSFATVALRDGTALVAGGVNADDVPYSSTWVFDPSTRGWRASGLLGEARAMPLMTALSDGRALILGGWGVGGGPDDLKSSEVYDPVTSSWMQVGSLPVPVSPTHLVGLGDGGALALGYDSTDTEPVRTAYVFDTSGGEWTRVDPPRHLYGFGLQSLGGGGALIFGGTNGGELEGGDGSVVDWVDHFDPASGQWSSQAPMSAPRIGSQAAPLPDGRALVAGGALRDDSLSGDLVTSAEVFDPSTGRWTAAGELLEPRQEGVATALQDGSVIVLGGNASFNTQGDTPFCPAPLTSVERFYPGS
jgi:Galactose oxidase, central domain/Kelch motif